VIRFACSNNKTLESGCYINLLGGCVTGRDSEYLCFLVSEKLILGLMLYMTFCLKINKHKTQAKGFYVA